MAIDKELLDNLFADYNYQKPEDLIGENGLLKQLTKAILERALQAEMDYADQGPEGGLEPFFHLVWRQNAGLLKTR